MQRYFLEKENEFVKDDIHHIVNVMRSKTGDLVEVCFNGVCNHAKLTVEAKMVTFEKQEKLPDNLTKNITLVQGLPKGEKLELVTKFATLFGAREILFVPMTRSIAKLSNPEHKLERLKKISKEAAELSKKSLVPNIDFIGSLKNLDLKNSVVLVADEDVKDLHLKDVISSIKNEKVIIVIGPEGGLDQKDRMALKSEKTHFVTLGATILPTELAHISILNAFY